MRLFCPRGTAVVLILFFSLCFPTTVVRLSVKPGVHVRSFSCYPCHRCMGVTEKGVEAVLRGCPRITRLLVEVWP